jgi:hypothetical protein
MIRRSTRVRTTRAAAAFVATAVLATLVALPASARTRQAVPAAQQGITSDQIQVVLLIPDIDTLKSKGISSLSTNESFTKKFTGYVDAFGPINGRKVNVKVLGWDPIDATSFDRVCTEATQDTKPFVVVNGTGYQTAAIPCIAVDNKTPFVYGDQVSTNVQKAAGKNLVAVREPTEVTAATTAAIIAKENMIPKSAKIGILSNNEPTLKAGADKLESLLKKKGYNVVSKVEVNGLSSDLGTIFQGSAAAADTMKAAGVDTVIHTQSFSTLRPFFTQADKIGAQFKYFGMDAQASGCQPDSDNVRDMPKSVDGMQCVTTTDFKTLPDLSGLKADSAFEATCRQQYDAATGKPSVPGSYGQDIGGTVYAEDFPAKECNIASILLPAIKKAGKNPTWDKVYANIMKTTKTPMAYASDGQGGYAKNKAYMPTKAQVAVLHYATADTPKDANGLYNGCPLPTTCFVPKTFGTQQWFPLQSN